MKVLTIRISDEMHQQLRYKAVDLHTSVQGVAVKAFEEFLRTHPQERKQPGKGIRGAK